MASASRRGISLAGAAVLLSAVFPALVSAVDLNLCADINTSSNSRNVSIYQTNGLCKDFCGADWAYAITQYNNCWCSNYTPAEDAQVDLGDCDINCPAYPDEKCGGKGLYGYIELIGVVPSGTMGDDSPTSTSTSTDDDETSAPTTKTTTSNGVIQTVTVGPDDPTETGDAEGGESGSSSGGGGGLGAGAIAGIVIGVLAAIGIGAALAFFFLRRRNKSGNDGYEDDPSVRGDSPGRTGSAHPDMSMAGGSLAGGSNSNRNSTLQIDPRMDPFNQGLYLRNGSHESINTLQDNHDYSRRILRATNPDAE